MKPHKLIGSLWVAFAGQSDPNSDNRLMRNLSRLLVVLSAILLFVIMCVTVVDVAGRNLFNTPLPGGYELTALLMQALFFISLPQICAKSGHITVNLIDGLIGPRMKWVLNLGYYILAAIMFSALTWFVARLAIDISRYGDVTLYLQIPKAPFLYFAAFSIASTALVYFALITRQLTGRK